jgi:hypothetical protein
LNVIATGLYKVSLSYSLGLSPKGEFSLTFKGVTLLVTVGSTTDWNKYTTVTAAEEVLLEGGTTTMKVAFTGGSPVNIDWVKFELVNLNVYRDNQDNPTTPPSTTPAITDAPDKDSKIGNVGTQNPEVMYGAIGGAVGGVVLIFVVVMLCRKTRFRPGNPNRV